MPKKTRASRRRTGTKRTGRISGKTPEDRSAMAMVKSLRGPNVKYINTTLGQGLATVNLTLAAPLVQLLNGVAQGTSENTRIGRLIRNKWIEFNLEASTGAFLGAILFRAYLVVESTALGSALAPGQFLIDAANFSPLSQRDRTNRNASRYCVLWDSGPKHIGGDSIASGQAAPAVSGVSPSELVWSKRVNLNFDTDYSRGNAGTVADIDTNSLHMLILTDDGNANHCFASLTWTLCFQDDS